MILDPAFADNRRVYLSFAELRSANAAGTAVDRAVLTERQGRPHLAEGTVIFRMNRPSSGTRHYGLRLAFAPDGSLFVTIGDRGERDRA